MTATFIENFTFGQDSSLLFLFLAQFEFISEFQEVTIHFCMKSAVKRDIVYRKFVFKF